MTVPGIYVYIYKDSVVLPLESLLKNFIGPLCRLLPSGGTHSVNDLECVPSGLL